MNSRFANTLAFAATAAAVACASLIASSPAYAESPTIDTTPFVSVRSRADVQAELMAGAELVRSGAREWVMQHNEARLATSGMTSEQARQQYIESRDQVSAFTGEDSGSAYLARQVARAKADSMTVAGATR